MFKKIGLVLVLASVLTSCSEQQQVGESNKVSQSNAKQITISTARGQIKVGQDPQVVAVFDLASLDTLDSLGVHVKGVPSNVLLPYLKSMTKNTQDMGTLFEPNYEALNAINPQLIIISGRTASKYDELQKIATTIDMSDNGEDLLNFGLNLINTYGQLFNKEEKAQALQHQIKDLIDTTKNTVKGKGNGLIVMINGEKLSVYGPHSRFGWIHKELAIPAADAGIQTASHGQPVSFEYLQKINPDWLFIIDRSAAIGEESKSAQAVLDNSLMKSTKAWQHNHIVYLSSASYVASGGAHQIQTDLTAIKNAFAKP